MSDFAIVSEKINLFGDTLRESGYIPNDTYNINEINNILTNENCVGKYMYSDIRESVPYTATNTAYMYYESKFISGKPIVTENTVNMSHMYYNCQNLKNLDSGADIISSNYNVEDMSYAFYNCQNFKQDPSSITADSVFYVKNMSYAFYNSGIKGACIYYNVEDASFAFAECRDLTKIHYDINMLYHNSTIKNAASMFRLCDNTNNGGASYTFEETLDLILRSPNIENISGICQFSDISFYNSLRIGNNVKDMSYAFYWSKGKTVVCYCGSNVVDMSYTYKGCENLLCGAPTYVENTMKNSIGPNVVDMTGCFDSSNCTYAYIGPNVVRASEAFNNCYNLKNIYDFYGRSFGYDNEFYFNDGFANCILLNDDNIDHMSFGPLSYLRNTFRNCSNLRYPPSISSALTRLENTFDGCANLNSEASSHDNAESLYYTYANCTNIFSHGYRISKLYNITRLDGTFYNCCGFRASDITINIYSNSTFASANCCFYNMNNQKAIKLRVKRQSAWDEWLFNTPRLFYKNSDDSANNISWTLLSNGYYNSARNIYVYNDL